MAKIKISFTTWDVLNVSLTLIFLPWTVIDSIDDGTTESFSGTVPYKKINKLREIDR